MEIADEHLAWIFGSSRSGSTWLLRMLAASGRVAPIDDPHIGHHLGVWRPIPLAWAAARELPELTTLTEVKRDKDDYFFNDRYRAAWQPALRALLEARFGAQAADFADAGPDPITVVKEPGSHAADMLLELFPGSRLIFLMRDGRDVVDSWLDAYQSGSWAQEEGAFAVAPQGRLPLVRWLSSVWAFRAGIVQRAYARHAPERRALVRYEDLLADTAGELGRVLAMLGIELERERVEEIAAQQHFDRVSPAEKGEGKAVRAAEPGAWRRSMTTAEKAAMHDVMGTKLAELGYGADLERLRRRERTRAA